MTTARPAWGIGLATVDPEDRTLDTWYPVGKLGLGALPLVPGEEQADVLDLPPGAVGDRVLPGLRTTVVVTEIKSLAEPPADTADAYLRLHLLSHRLVRPNELNLDGVFGVLPNVAWTSAGPCPPERVDELRVIERAAGRHLAVYGVDKFPRMTDYVVPSGVRIADADRVRLGAHLAPGTTVMHEGFVNFNAGTLGASIMGTLSGGGKEVIRIGERCLIGANGGVGISLGDDSVVEAGCYITAGSKVRLPDGRVVKARELSGVPGLLFWRDSQSGALEARPRPGTGAELNAALHAND